MTPDGPKGPESEAASLRNRIESAIVWARQDYDHNGNLIIPREAAANAAWSEVVPELARLTEEVALFRGRDGLTRKALQVDGAGPLQFAALIVRQARDRALAEVSRLREQLAAQPALPQVDDERVDRVARALHEQRALEFAWNVKPWKDLRPEDQRRFRRQAMAAVEAVFAGVAPQSDVVTSEASPVQHGVLVEHVWRNVYATWCPACEVGVVGSQSKAEDWKDQHEADTLRPTLTNDSATLTNESSISQQDACSVCGSTEIQYQPFSGGKEYYCPSCETTHPYDEGQAPRRAQMLQRGEFSALKQEMREHLDEGRPSGSERLAPRSDEELRAKLDLAMDTLGSIWLYVNWRYVTGKLTTEQRELWANAVDDFGDPQDRGPKAERWWRDDALAPAHDEVLDRLRAAMGRDAAQAARSEATPKMLAPDPAWPYREGTYDLTDLPSPSLRKEQDTHDYLSTACLHGQHDYCVAPVVSREGQWAVIGPSYTSEQGAPKNPAQCKFCAAKCRCGCHEPPAVSSQEGKEGETE